MDDRAQSGFTLVELLVTLAVVAILVTTALPALSDLLDSQRLRATAQKIATDLRYARSEAIKRHADIPIGVSFTPGSDWCYGISQQLPCDCHEQDWHSPNACLLDLAHERQLHTSATDTRAHIELLDTSFSSDQTQFDPLRGIANAGSVSLRSARGKTLNIIVSTLGRVRICAPEDSDSPTGYTPC
ncbi:MAG TPA: GspH/FimT family pseudopilin [Gammaproteobacteria bacterium]|nr:GspH/FimT family pseudopilin [Gammaproteobacteria bacterium]